VNSEPDHVKEESIVPAYVHIYPNPNSGDLSVKLDESYLNASIQIYDASDKIFFNRKNINNNLLQVSNLKSGIYNCL
jgi:hypothetical protein